MDADKISIFKCKIENGGVNSVARQRAQTDIGL